MKCGKVGCNCFLEGSTIKYHSELVPIESIPGVIKSESDYICVVNVLDQNGDLRYGGSVTGNHLVKVQGGLYKSVEDLRDGVDILVGDNGVLYPLNDVVKVKGNFNVYTVNFAGKDIKSGELGILFADQATMINHSHLHLSEVDCY